MASQPTPPASPTPQSGPTPPANPDPAAAGGAGARSKKGAAPGTGRGSVAAAAKLLAEATSQLRVALTKELGDASSEMTQKVAASLQEAARSLDDVAAKVGVTPKAQRTREELLAAAARVFSAKGYEGASVGEIAEAAGYTKGALYAHFGSKEKLFLELGRTYCANNVAQTEQVDTGGLPFLEWFCGSIPQALQDNPEEDLMVLNQEFALFGLRHPEYRQEIAELEAASRDALARRIAADRLGTSAGPGTPVTPEDTNAATTILALANGLLISHYLGVAGVNPDMAREALARLAQ